MIDRAARDQAAALLRDFVERRLGGRELERRFPAGPTDPALRAIGSCVWFHYDDLSGDTPPLSPDGRAVLDRCIAFLRSDEEYLWPVRSLISFRALLLHPVVSGLLLVLVAVLFRRDGRAPLHPWDLFLVPLLWIALLRLRNVLEARHTRRLRAVGDPRAWPFLRNPG